MLAPLTLLLLAAPALSYASPQGSLEALLDRISHHKRGYVQNTGARIGMRGTGVIEQEMMRKQKAKREEMKREVEIVDGNRMAKLYKKRGSGGGHGKNKNRKHEKKWVWGTEIIQDSTPTDGLPAIGANADLLTSNIDVATPTLSIENPLATTIPTNATPLLNTTFLVNGTLLSNGAIDLTLANGTLVSLVNSTISVGGSNYTLAEDDNSLVDSVSGDDAIVEVSSTNGVDGEGIVELSLVDAVQIDEPALDLEIGTAPTAAEVLVLKRAASDHEKRAFEGGLVKGQLAPRHRDGEGRDVNVLKKRWVWATEIIQDSTPPSGLPPIGVNANLLTPAIAVATPVVVTPAPAIAPAPSTTAAVTTTRKESKAEEKMHGRLGHKRDLDLEERELKRAERKQEKRQWVWDTVVIQNGDTAAPQDSGATPGVDFEGSPFAPQATPGSADGAPDTVDPNIYAPATTAAATPVSVTPAPVAPAPTVVDKEAALALRKAAHKHNGNNRERKMMKQKRRYD